MLPADLITTPIDRAIAAGHDADRLGYAFAAGYGAALETLVPGVPPFTSLCATEEGGAHPRAIATTLRDGRLVGKKKWATAAATARLLLVVASIGERDGKNRLVVVKVDPRAPGVTMTEMPPPPFAPEIGHASVTLDTAVTDDQVLPGDGYDAYLKPFRTIEDIHVHGAVLGWMLGLGERHRWPPELIERLLAATATMRQLAAAPASAPTTHLALAGAIAAARELVERAPWDTLDPEALARWRRDRPLLEVAGKARAARLEAARTKML